MPPRVVITGMGAVSALGRGREALWEGLKSGRSGLRAISLFDTGPFRSGVGGEVPGYAARDDAPRALQFLEDAIYLAKELPDPPTPIETASKLDALRKQVKDIAPVEGVTAGARSLGKELLETYGVVIAPLESVTAIVGLAKTGPCKRRNTRAMATSISSPGST